MHKFTNIAKFDKIAKIPKKLLKMLKLPKLLNLLKMIWLLILAVQFSIISPYFKQFNLRISSSVLIIPTMWSCLNLANMICEVKNCYWYIALTFTFFEKNVNFSLLRLLIITESWKSTDNEKTSLFKPHKTLCEVKKIMLM